MRTALRFLILVTVVLLPASALAQGGCRTVGREGRAPEQVKKTAGDMGEDEGAPGFASRLVGVRGLGRGDHERGLPGISA